MSHPIGSDVVVVTLGRKRGTVVDAADGGRYRVQVGSTVVACRERDLEPAPAERPARRPSPRTASLSPARASRLIPRVDLHGLTVEEARARVIDAIDDALRRGADGLEVIHGRGSGRVRAGVHRLLAELPGIANVRLDERNPGVTWVTFQGA